ncbi:MAG TPA: GntR family transcriptional regulator [Leptolinea sp.]
MKNTDSSSLLSSQAYQLIKDDIVTCSLGPGQFIAQLELTEKYRVGLTPVREALRQLAQEGFVQPVPRMGYIVSQITPKDVQEIYEMRIILETSSVRMAATHGTEIEFRSLLEAADFTYTYQDHPSYSRFLGQNKGFHQRIAVLSRNARLVQQISRTMDELTRVFHLGLDLRDSADEMRNDHVALANSLLQRDANLAERLIRSEILISRERVMEAIKSYSGPILSPENLMNINFQSSL